MLTNLLFIGFFFGLYDFFIKLASGKTSPVVGSIICQFFSFLSIAVYWLYIALVIKQPDLNLLNKKGFVFSSIAGVLISLALVSLFYCLQNPHAKTTIVMPLTLILRNIVLVLLSVIILKEDLSLVKIIGLVFSLTGIYLITR